MVDLQVKEYSSPQEFLTELLPQLEHHELENAQVISKSKLWHQNKVQGGYYIAVLDEHDNLIYAAAWAPGNHLWLSWSPPEGGQVEAQTKLAIHAARKSLPLTEFQGCEPGVLTFAKAYTTALKRSFVVQRSMTTYRLTSVNIPVQAQYIMSHGNLKRATVDDDMKILANWLMSYNEQCLMPILCEEEAIKYITSRVRAEHLYLWVLDKKPVSMACLVRPLKYGCSVAGVYTPKEFRGQGYATAMMAVFSEHLRKDYDFVSLLADNSNPTSNYIYQQVGFKKTCITNDYLIV
ncbi:hypothetical protein POJ06DRAFT_69486 [Lipomyces tetrasporus]|uniref:N-acetyltransferase domain-containing protein n=1 Tax=Lipomyces tetrasporus TaxID=54092 RepID=A0AAD7QUK8_9ASCO|nr:uncharacterized protein POJ06DRAFT_69486 [Lipomyces tetrasporus]KAJ8101699.1 hypothetical protein POJ06DRAFT_69486 [Lipomyces tetrasporus]